MAAHIIIRESIDTSLACNGTFLVHPDGREERLNPSDPRIQPERRATAALTEARYRGNLLASVIYPAGSAYQ